jgi:hypothetical protein
MPPTLNDRVRRIVERITGQTHDSGELGDIDREKLRDQVERSFFVLIDSGTVFDWNTVADIVAFVERYHAEDLPI